MRSPFRSVLIVAFAFTLTACGGKAKSFDSVSVRGPMHTQQLQTVNAVAAGDLGVRLYRQQLAFIVGSVRAAEKPPSLSVEPRSVVVSAPTVATTAEPTSLPPEYVCQRESHCTYGINTGNGYFGKWQFSFSWAGKLGLPADITQATPAQEDEAARQLWNNGAGCGNWSGPDWSACG